MIAVAGCVFQWEDQHEGVSCQQFQAWKEANDPEHQAAGLAKILEENGIGKTQGLYKTNTIRA